MKQFIALCLALLLAGSANGAGVFDGDSDLLIVESGTAINYPILMSCEFQADDTDHRGTLVALTNNAAGGTLDGIALEIRGDTGGDRISATSWAADNSSSATTSDAAVSTTKYYRAIAIFNSASSRRIRDGIHDSPGVVWREETTTRSAGNWTHLSVGALYDDGPTNQFSGKIKNVRVYFGAAASAMIADASLTISSGNWPNKAQSEAAWLAIRPQLVLGLGLGRLPFDYKDWNLLSEVTNRNVTFDYVP